MLYGITKEELHPSLIQYIQSLVGSGGDGNSSLRFMKNTVTLSSNSREVNIGIERFNKDTDLILVYKNSIYLEYLIDFTISSDNSKIISIDSSEIYNSGDIFNFVALINCPELSDYTIDGNKLLKGSVSIDKLDSQLSESLNILINGFDIDAGSFGEVEDGKIMDGGEF